MNIRKTYLSLLLICSTFIGFAQDGIPTYSDYFSDNIYLLHPATAGAANYYKLRLSARQQWFDQDEAPNLQTLSFNARLTDRSGIGAIVFNDQNGYHSQVGGYLTYAHHIQFGRSNADLNQLSFGLSAGLIQSRLDETQFDPNDFDPIVAGIIQSSSYFNADVGVSYYFLNFSGHVTAKNVLFQNRNLFTDEIESNNQRTYLISSAYFIPTTYGRWAFEPSFLFQWKERTGEQSIDVNFKAFREVEFGRVWGGISYRRSFDGSEFLDGTEIKDQKLQFITPVIGVNYNKFVFAYTYTHQSGSIRFDNGGFHQITLGYNFLEGKITRWSQDMRYNGMLRPRGY
ncbi:type IX secretion system membrane protein PorP/SprF [Aureisphaera galaxeae]|uniref:PorP/SprF family type IX secretion system membrane protein n=1 Tax=Aureisphaera galaxeae TaxID=1538023 RepID=UPI0023502966|nr:type IX secretion system membrane protein PorP/SprF [Aureisphaera galaxeae]MDC8005728.1 type IX secretion system membrane protein PorP/SprF [Aureisphaera galaxeae]